MTDNRSLKRAAIAASVLAVAAATAAHAAPLAYAPAPTEVAAPIAHAADKAQAKPAIAEKVGLAAAATAALAALYHLIGAERLLGWLRAARPAAKKAAVAVARAPVAAARAVGRAAASPLRTMLWIGALAVFAFTGVSLFDIEWAGGLVAGAALVAAIWAGSRRTQALFARIRRRPSDAPRRES